MVVKAASRHRGHAPRLSSPALASRNVALDILAAVLDRGRPLDDALDDALDRTDLEPRDRGFARVLATATLRRIGQIDDALGRMIDRQMPLKPAAMMNLLRLGAVQLLFLDVPAHAAVATAVDLADAIGLGRGKGMANAVLRRLAREGAEIVASQDAAQLNTAPWLWIRWVDTYGERTARAICAQHAVEPPLDLTLKPGEDLAKWAETLGAAVLPTGTLRRPVGGRIEDLPGFAEGVWWVQDAAAALPARLLGNVAGKVVFDLCAAPGGKTMQLAAAGAAVTAIDRSAARLAMVDSNLSRIGLSATSIAADALAWKPRGLADAVLLDAPCTATGTIRRHPDVQFAREPKDLAQLSGLQAALLDRAVKLVRPGGAIVYCTCSLEREEGESQIARALDRHSGLARLPIAAGEIGGLAMLINADGDLRTLPCHLAEQGGLDGFFAARLIRKE
jgi:16S rRNA (cytosine967-C5)-methyltransferase